MQAGTRISPQLSLAVFQFLSAQVEPFGEVNLTPSILKRLIKKSELVVELKHTDAKPVFIYEKDKPADFFCLILEGEELDFILFVAWKTNIVQFLSWD